MTTLFHFPRIFTLVLCSLCVETVHSATVVHFISNMPKDSSPLKINCNANGGSSVIGHPLKVGEDYQWRVTKNDIYYCTTMWGIRFFGAWHAYEPRRDTGHAKIFWRVDEDGFFLSSDRSSWKKEASWETD